jgi:spore germination cell wall hydrolase CwlJ-like protein
MAAKAIKYTRSIALEPMTSYERHVIHTALQDYEGVSTSSIGTEPNRRVVVNYERPAGESGESRRSRDKRAERPHPPKTEKAPAQEKAEAPAEQPAKETLPPDYPEGYTPPSKNKPQSREWC